MRRLILVVVVVAIHAVGVAQQSGEGRLAAPDASLRPDSLSSLYQRTSGRWFSLGGGMGVSVVSPGDIVDYMNTLVAPEERIDDFGTAVEFFVTPEYRISTSWALKAEYSYLLKTFNVSGGSGLGTYEFTYEVHMPTLVLQYLIVREGYLFKFGAGVGYHIGSFTWRFPSSIVEANYSARGIGAKLEAAGHTSLGDNLYATIVGDIRLDFVGDLVTENGRKLENVVLRRNVSLDFVSLGLKFGLMYYF